MAEPNSAARESFPLRIMHQQDIPDGLRLTRMAGWNQLADDWRFFLQTRPTGSFVALQEDESIVATAATIGYAERVAWIGMVLVDPACRRRGIAKRLLTKCCESLAAFPTVGLDATPEGRTVYAALGFQDAYELVRLTTDSLTLAETSAAHIQPLDAVAESLVALDAATFGAERQGLLEHLHARHRAASFVAGENSALNGFCLGRPGNHFFQLGPLAADTSDSAIALCQRALSPLAGQAVVIDVPKRQVAFLAWLGTCGFREERSFIRMVKGAESGGIPAQQFAIAGPEFG